MGEEEGYINGVKLKVGDIVILKDEYDPPRPDREKHRERIVGVYPMNNIPYAGRVDIVDEHNPSMHGSGIPVRWIKQIV